MNFWGIWAKICASTIACLPVLHWMHSFFGSDWQKLVLPQASGAILGKSTVFSPTFLVYFQVFFFFVPSSAIFQKILCTFFRILRVFKGGDPVESKDIISLGSALHLFFNSISSNAINIH